MNSELRLAIWATMLRMGENLIIHVVLSYLTFSI